MLKKGAAVVGLLLACGGMFAVGQTDSKSKKNETVVAVSILPQRYFLERIGGDRVTAIVLVGPGQSPHAYEPTPSQMAALSGAKSWILSGTDFEKSLRGKVAAQFPKLRIVDGTQGVTFRKLQEYEQELGEDEHEGEGEHHDLHDSNIDRHSWLGQKPAIILATHIHDELVAIDPAGKTLYDANYTTLVKEIDAEFADLKSALAPLSGKTVMVFHPSFGYFLDEFGMKQASVETGGKEPTAKMLAALIAKAKAEKVPAIFVQAQFPVNAAKTVAMEAGAQVIPLDPLAPDWLGNIRKIGETLKKAYK